MAASLLVMKAILNLNGISKLPSKKPNLIPDSLNWKQWTKLASEIRDGKFVVGGRPDPDSARIQAELLYAAGQFDTLFRHVDASFDKKIALKMIKDFMMRLDRRCSAFTAYPGQAIMLGGDPGYTFPIGGQ